MKQLELPVTYQTRDGRTLTHVPVKYKGGYAAQPGSGPEGESCVTCKNLSGGRYHNRTYYKCALIKPTHGPGTDIRLRAPACSFWAQP